MSPEDQAILSTPKDIIDAARNGRMFILVDDEKRENEGDLVIPAQMATPEAINFMAKYGRGLICLALGAETVHRLGLPLISTQNKSRHETAFTTSIEAREGVTTGISAADRARTIQVAIDPNSSPADLVSPGHVFPLAAKRGGVLVRAGHTEAGVDIARLAGLNPSAVICEIMNDDGTMARLPDLVSFAQLHGLMIGTIADLIAHRRHTEKLVEVIERAPFESHYGGNFELVVYADKMTGIQHLALVKGDIARAKPPVLVRMHALNLLEDALFDAHSPCSHELQTAMRMIDEADSGVIVIINETAHPNSSGLAGLLRRRNSKPETETGEHQPEQLRDYGIGAQILVDLGISEMELLSNAQHQIVGLEGYGLSIVGQRPIPLS